MQPSSRDGRRGNNTRSMNSAFTPFPDPFAGFGGRPFFSDMFENDPFFSDPFFTRPFGSPFGSAGSHQSLFGSAGGLFGPNGFFNSGLFQQPSGLLQQENFIDQRPYNPPAEGNRRTVPVEGARRGVHIEELPDDHDMVCNGPHTSNQEPIIEHPSDEEKTDDSNQQRRMTHRDNARNQSRSVSGLSRSPNNPPVRGYSFQSASVTYGGVNGPYYASQTTRRQGSDGVIEEEHQEKDTTSGKETHRISRGLGDKGRSLTRKRNAEGREQNLETLHNLAEDEVQDFERSWETAAEKSLPRWNKGSSQRVGSSSKARPALPSSGPGPSGN